MNLKKYLDIKDFLKLELIDNVFAFISAEDDELIIEISKDKDYFEKVNVEHLVNVNFDTDINKIKDILIHDILEQYIMEHI